MPFFGLELLRTARNVAAFDLPARVGLLIGVSIKRARPVLLGSQSPARHLIDITAFPSFRTRWHRTQPDTANLLGVGLCLRGVTPTGVNP
jgi:hypothetical protein